MSIMPMKHKCPVCRKYYQWNPDVGMTVCTKCGRDSNGMYLGEMIKIIKKIRCKKP